MFSVGKIIRRIFLLGLFLGVIIGAKVRDWKLVYDLNKKKK